jgi:hypothetical protein
MCKNLSLDTKNVHPRYVFTYIYFSVVWLYRIPFVLCLQLNQEIRRMVCTYEHFSGEIHKMIVTYVKLALFFCFS